MIYIQIFWAFFISGILSYGGGPSVIPLIKEQVVDRYHWMNNHDFSEMIAAANALPGPIATKMAGYIGYDVASWQGATVALFAAIAPTLVMMIALLGILMKYKNSSYVKNLTAYIRPIIGVLFVLITAAEEVAASVNEIATNAGQIAEGASTTLETMDMQHQTLQDLQEEANQLKERSVTLQSAVNQFKF